MGCCLLSETSWVPPPVLFFLIVTSLKPHSRAASSSKILTASLQELKCVTKEWKREGGRVELAGKQNERKERERK